MAPKKKGGKSGKPSAPAAKDPEPVKDLAPTEEVALEKSPYVTPDAASTSDAAALQAENESLKAELAQLKATLAMKDEEIVQLRAHVGDAKTATANLNSAGKTSGEMTALQERLAKLKRDQMEADAARDTAWAELKRCVSEVAKLANAGLSESQSITSN